MEAESGRPSLALAMRVSRAMRIHLVRSTSLQPQPQTHLCNAATSAGWALIKISLQGVKVQITCGNGGVIASARVHGWGSGSV